MSGAGQLHVATKDKRSSPPHARIDIAKRALGGASGPLVSLDVAAVRPDTVTSDLAIKLAPNKRPLGEAAVK
jgi:hypothetical protein